MDIYNPQKNEHWNMNASASAIDIHEDWSPLEYDINLPQAGEMIIQFDMRHIGIEEVTGGVDEFYFMVNDGNLYKGMITVKLKNGGRDTTSVEYRVTGLSAGDHRIKLTWIGKMYKPGHWDLHPELKNLSFSQEASQTQPAPTVQIPSIPSITNQKDLTVSYTVNGQAKSKVFTLTEGTNNLQIDEVYGGTAVLRSSFQVTLDTQAPEITLPALPATTESTTLPITWTSDGRERTDSFTLAEGLNSITLKSTDAAGNSSEKTIQIRRTIPAGPTPKPAPVMIVQNPPAAITTQGSLTIDYTLDGEARQKTYTLKPGENVLTLSDADAQGQSVSQSFWVTRIQEAPAGTEGFTLKTQSDDLLLYQAGALQQITTADGHLLEHLRLSADGRILDAQIRYADGTIELLENGASVGIRRPDGSKYIYRTGLLEKIIAPDGSETLATHAAGQITLESASMRAVYTAAGVIVRLEDKGSGAVTAFENGVVRSVKTASAGVEYVYQVSEGPQAGQSRLTAPASDAAAKSALPFLEAIYGADGLPVEITGFDGTILRFDEGRISESVDASGHPVRFDVDQSALGHLVGVSLVQGSLRSSYSADGNLRSVDTGDLTIHYRGDEIEFIETDDGLLIQDPVFDGEGALRSAKIIDADGGVKLYTDGRLTTYLAPDGSRYRFDGDGRPVELENAQKIRYTLTYDALAQSYIAEVDASFIPDLASTATLRMEYDADLNMKKYVRKNGEITRLLNIRQPDGVVVPRIDQIELDGQIRHFVYETDTSGNKLTKVIDGATVTLYDESGTPLESTVLPSSADGATIRTVYRYGKIREVFKNGVQTLAYSYTYGANGTETTHIRDLTSGTVKDYRSGLLQTSTEESTSVVSTYAYLDESRVKEVVLSRLGRELARYTYSYEGDSTKITDHQGVTRVFDAQDRLVAIESGIDRREFDYFQRADIGLPDTLDLYSQLNPSAELLRDMEKARLGWVVVGRDAAGRATDFRRSDRIHSVTYDEQGRLSAETVWGVMPPESTGTEERTELLSRMMHAYDPSGRIQSTRTVDLRDRNAADVLEEHEGEMRVYDADASGRLIGYRDMPADPLQTQTPSAIQQTAVVYNNIIRERLVLRRLEDGSIVYFENDQPVRIENRPDGVVITEIALDADLAVKRAVMTFPDGIKRVFEYGRMIDEILADGTRIHYSGAGIEYVLQADGVRMDYAYVTEDGIVQSVWIRSTKGRYQYDLNGDLIGLEDADGAVYTIIRKSGANGDVEYWARRFGLEYKLDMSSGRLTHDTEQLVQTQPDGSAIRVLPLNSNNDSQFYGDGRDGLVRLTADTEIDRDMFYESLTIDPGVTLKSNGHKIFVKDRLINHGTITADGLGAAGGAGGGPSGWAQINGRSGSSVTWSLGGVGGAGGIGGYAVQTRVSGRNVYPEYRPGGNSGSGGALSSIDSVPSPLDLLDTGVVIQGGSGGGGGGAGSSFSTTYPIGGTGGVGGGVLHIFAKIIDNQGLISANGTDGGMGATGSAGAGGGGGGGGGVLYLVSSDVVGGKKSVLGGQGGLKGVNPQNIPNYMHSQSGAAGAAGSTVTFRSDSIHLSFGASELAMPFIEHAQKVASTAGKSLTYMFGRLLKTASSGQISEYSYALDGSGSIQKTMVHEQSYKLVYDEFGALQGLALDAIPEAKNVSAQISYTGGMTPEFSTDGDPNTAQWSDGLGAISAAYTFDSPQTVTRLSYKVDAWAESQGHTNNGAGAQMYVQYLDAESGEWRTIEATIQKQEHNNGGGGGATAFIPVREASLDVNLTGVLGLRLTVNASAYSNEGGGPIRGYTRIFEFDYRLEEQNYLALQRTESGYAFKNAGVSLAYDSGGGLVSVQSAFSDLLGAPEALSGRLPGLLRLPMEKVFPVLPGWADTWTGVFAGAVAAADTVMSREYRADGRMETQTTANLQTTIYNDDGKPEAVINASGQTVISYAYDEDGHLEQVYLKEARSQLPDQIAKAEAAVQADRAEALRRLAESKQLAFEQIRQQAEAARAQAQSYLTNLQSGMNSLASSKAQGKQGKKAKSAAMDQYRDALQQVQDQINQINRMEAEAYEDLDIEVQTFSQTILTDAGDAIAGLREQEAVLKKEIIRQEITPVAFDVYRRTLGRDPSTEEYKQIVSRIDYQTGRVILQTAAEDEVVGLPAVTFDGAQDYLTVADPLNTLSVSRRDFEVSLEIRVLDPDRNQTILDIGGWSNGLRLNYQGSQQRLEWHIQGTEYGIWNFRMDPQKTYAIVLRRQSGMLRMYVDGALVHETANNGSIIATQGIRIGRELNNNGDLRGVLGRLRIDVEGTRVLEIAPSPADEFIKDQAGNSKVFNHGDSALSLSAGWLKRTDSVTRVTATAKLAPILAQELLATDEHRDRTVFVDEVKAGVVRDLRAYLAMDASSRTAYAAALGLSASDLIPLPAGDAESVIEWIEGGSLHFGQSAFNALELLLEQEGKAVDKLALAKQSILIDILTGVITPLDEGDLILSMFALKKALALADMRSEAMKMGWEDLKQVYDDSGVIVETEVEEIRTPGVSVDFGSGQGYLTVPDPTADMDFGEGDFTVESWFNLSASGSELNTIASKNHGNAWSWIFYARKNELGVYYHTGSVPLTGYIDIQPGEWHHAAVSREGDTLRIFLDGNLVASHNVQGKPFGGGTDPLLVGAYNGGSSGRFQGRIEDLRITRRAVYSKGFVASDIRSGAEAATMFLLREADGPSGKVLKDFSAKSRPVSIVGQALLDTQNRRTSTLQRTEKSVLRRGPPGTDLASLTEEQKSAIIQNPDRYNPRLIAHINGNHYVVVVNVTDTSVTYIDTSIGEDGKNEVVTVTKEEFLQAWKGYVFSSEAIALKAAGDSPGTVRILTDREAQDVRGAFFGNLLGILGSIFYFLPGTQPLGFILTAISATISAIQGDWLSAISSLVTIGLGGTGGLFKGLDQVFTGIQNAVLSVGSFLGGVVEAIAAPVSGFFNSVTSGLKSVIGAVQGIQSEAVSKIVHNALATGISFGVSKGLDALGVDPGVSSLIGSFASGAFLGSVADVKPGKTQLDMLQSNVFQINTMHHGFKLGTELGLAPDIAQVLSLGLGAITGDLSNAGNATGDLAKAFKNVLPNISGALTNIGISTIGEKMGLAPTLTNLIASPVGGLIGAVGSGAQSGASVVKIVQDQILRSGTSLLLDYVAEKNDWDPLVTGLVANVSTGALLGMLNGEGIFKGSIDSYIRSTGSLLSLDSSFMDPNSPSYQYEKARYLLRVQNFSDSIKTNGLAQTLETHAAQIFQRDAIENLFRDGGAIDFITKRAEPFVFNGQNSIKLNASTTESSFLDPATYDLLGRVYQNPNGSVTTERGSYAFDESGHMAMKDGVISTTLAGHTLYLEVQGFELQYASFAQGTRILQDARPTDQIPLILKPNSDGSFEIISGMIYDHTTHTKEVYSSGKLIGVSHSAVLEYEALSGAMHGSVISTTREFKDGEESGIELNISSTHAQEIKNKNASAVKALADEVIPQVFEVNEPEAVSWLQELNLKRSDFVGSLEDQANKVFDALKSEPMFNNWLLDLPTHYGNLGVELTRMFVVGTIDALNFGKDLPVIWDDAQQAWKSAQDGDIPEASRRVLNIGKNTFIEAMRGLTLLPLVGGGIKLAGKGTTLLVEEALTYSDDVARLMKSLLGKTDEASVAKRNLLFADSKNTAIFHSSFKNMDEAVDLLRKGQITPEDLNAIANKLAQKGEDVLSQLQNLHAEKKITDAEVGSVRITRDPAQVNAEFKAKKSDNEAPWEAKVTVEEFITYTEEQYIRFLTPAKDANGQIIIDLMDGKAVNIGSDFLVKKSDLLARTGKTHLTSQEIKDLLALPGEARSHFTIVTVPKGVKIRTGMTGAIKDWGNGGVEQYQLIAENYPRGWFTKEIKIGEYFVAAD